LSRLNNDLVNLIGRVQMAIVIVGPDLRIRRFTPAAEKLLNLRPADLGRPLADIRLNLDGVTDLGPLLTDVIDTVSVKACDVRDTHGHWYSLRLRPYRTVDNKVRPRSRKIRPRSRRCWRPARATRRSDDHPRARQTG
jgi:two-component system CheB/CheR fusion protein